MPANKTPRRFYAITYTYGIAVTDDPRRPGRTKPAGSYVSFPTLAARDAWVADGASYRNQPDYREAVPSHDPHLQRALAIDAADGADYRGTGGWHFAVRWIEDIQEEARRT